MIKELKNRIRTLLESNKKYRSSDYALMARIWFDDIGISINQTSAIDLLCMIRDGEVTKWESAVRCRRKIQELHPHLRPVNNVYNARQVQQEKWIEELNEMK